MLNLDKKRDKILNSLKGKLYNAGLFLEGEVKKIVAIDTGNLHDNIRTFPVKEMPNSLVVEVGTDNVFYAGYVEEGVGKVFNYHRNKKVVYTGVGQHYLQRAYLDNVQTIIDKLK